MMMKFMSQHKPPPVTVSASHAVYKTWQPYLTAVGTLTAINGVDISAQVSGIIKTIAFKSGQVVEKDDILLTLDMGIERADLKNNQAQLELAKLNYERDKKLFEKRTVARSALDTSHAKFEEAKATMARTKAIIDQKAYYSTFFRPFRVTPS